MEKVEYIVACSTCSEVVWLHQMLVGLFDTEVDVTNIHCNNHSCIKMTESLVFHDKLKHIKIRYHYIRDMVQKGSIKVKYVPKEEQVLDVLINPMSCVNFEYF